MRILDEVAGAKTIGISGHIRPDGDCVGSCLGMKLFLEKAMPEAKVDCYLEKPADFFSCIKGFDQIKTEATAEMKYDAFIVLDSVPQRTGFAEPLYNSARKKINIDHHISNKGGSDADYIIADASSSCEVVYDVIDKDLLDKDIALAIYVGIIHDTGVMQYSNTKPKTLRTVADLLEFDFPFSRIIDETFYEKTFVQNQLLGEALLGSSLHHDGRIAVSIVTKELLERYHATSMDLEGVVNQLRLTKGVDVAIFLYELEPGVYKASLRSTEAVDVAKVVVEFGGGGHVRAAGATLPGDPEASVQLLIREILKQMDGK